MPEDATSHKSISKMTILIAPFVIAFIIIFGVWLYNYLVVGRPLKRVLNADPRNSVIQAEAHFERWLDLNTVVFNLTGITGKATRMDVFRSFLQYAEAMKDHRYGMVILADRGKARFRIEGSYFQQLGQEYATQNPMYTIRTFPVHLFAMDGTKPFSEYEGGILGVMQKEMEQFTAFSDQWYGADLRLILPPVDSLQGQDKKDTNIDPCESARELDPHCGWKPHWEDSGISTNAIDGTKTQFLSLESSDADGIDYGKLHYAELRICFQDGKLCGGQHIGVLVNVHGMVAPLGYETGQEYSTSVRLRFDEEKPLSETWGIADSHDALFPYGHERKFLAQLMQHNRVVVEFSYYEKAARTLTFDISGLVDKMKSQNLESLPLN